jgi:hypothetical protein
LVDSGAKKCLPVHVQSQTDSDLLDLLVIDLIFLFDKSNSLI